MKSVLIVDDSYYMRKLVKTYLTRHDIQIAGEAENGKIAIKKYQECHPDVVTMDITMPVMNGIEALSEIIKIDKNAKVIMVSSMGQEFLIRDAVLAGAQQFIIKPFSEKQITDAVNKVMKSND